MAEEPRTDQPGHARGTGPRPGPDQTKEPARRPSEGPPRASGQGDSGHGGGTVPRTGPDEAEEAAALRRERDEYLDALQRLKAEFDNYRKRAARDQESLVARANERLVKELLAVVDDLARALEAAEAHQEAQLEEGVRLVHRSLADLLRREGLEEIDTGGRFDPHVHEALLSQPSDQEEGSVVEVVQKGYKLGDRILRPARVVVAGPSREDE